MSSKLEDGKEKVDRIIEEMKRRLRHIQEAVDENRVITAAYYIKTLAVYLDRQGWGERLKVLMEQ
jgi:hypothetical protein